MAVHCCGGEYFGRVKTVQTERLHAKTMLPAIHKRIHFSTPNIVIDGEFCGPESYLVQKVKNIDLKVIQIIGLFDESKIAKNEKMKRFLCCDKLRISLFMDLSR